MADAEMRISNTGNVYPCQMLEDAVLPENTYCLNFIIGSIRRDCLDHVVVLNDRHLKRILIRYFNYYHRWRTHLSLGMDSPESRSVQIPDLGKVV